MEQQAQNATYTLDDHWLYTRIFAYNKARDRCLEAWITRHQDLAAKLNAGIKPTIGRSKNGEPKGLHAPHDGYVYEWLEGDATRRKTFMGGQFLPIDKRDDAMFDTTEGRVGVQHRIPLDAPSEKLTQVKDVLESLRLEFLYQNLEFEHGNVRDGFSQKRFTFPYFKRGREWIDRNGLRQSYEYLCNVTDDVAEHIENFLMGEIYAARAAAAEQREQERQAAEPCPTGRINITGEVVSVKTQYDAFGPQFKMLVKDDRGFKVWGTIPKAIDPSAGCRVSFVAAVEPSGDDNKFGFYKRPSKAVLLDEAALAAS